MDEETQHYISVRKIKLSRLHELDRQAAAHGEFNVPPHVQMERTSLREELGMVEAAINSPARAEVTEELGQGGRFIVNYQQNREIKQSIAALSIEIGTFMNRQQLIIIGVAVSVVVILVGVVAVVTYIFTRGGM